MDPVSLFLRKLLERLNTQLSERTNQIAAGKGIVEIQDYRERVGYIRGLRDAANWAGEIFDEGPGNQNANRAIKQKAI